MIKSLTYTDLVTACYRTLLRREPENDDVVNRQAADIPTPEDVIRTFLESEEHQALCQDGPALINVAVNNLHDALDIDVEVPPETLGRMFERIKGEWKTLGETEPYWSVLTADQYHSARIQENLETFYASGQSNVTWMNNIARRNGVTLGKGQTCFELGCGVGRVTLPLSELFDHVTGFDISPGNLAEARAIINSRGNSNITLHQMAAIEDIHKAPRFDVLFTVIVLQHNPPPVQKYILEALLDKINPGGVAYFQLPTYIPGYAFSSKSYLEDSTRGMEMHAVPMKAILDVLDAKGFRVLEVIQDNFTGMPGSHSFFATKTR
ncbi:class I SAM-dependent methyltransferase [Sulfitobacter sp. F26204]|uniref:class I SAM-dependent methyltransferase n=1 Tax=Sulfitobacter sp. F26204 TaxID=2996014 RepID=UPI00225DF759|nr:class I SAM-dependent methyltransferase [Sulfitobacter sp. F26204]MCX7561915.1 class I SAM-dependent methyltransferase [Sulfitobacter sp. F26204]